MIRQLSPYLPYYPYILVSLIAAALVILLLAMFYLWRQRSAEIWRNRHNAGKIGSRLLFVGLSLLIGSLSVAAFSGVLIFSLGYQNRFFPPSNPYGLVGVAVTALPDSQSVKNPFGLIGVAVTALPSTNLLSQTPRAVPTQMALPTATPSPQPPSATPTQTRAPSSTPRPSRTPVPPSATPTLAPIVAAWQQLGITPPASDITLLPTSGIRILAMSDQLTESRTPLNPRRTFERGVRRLYFFVSYQDVQDGAAWTRLLYRDGELLQGTTSAWRWGAQGANYFSLSNLADYPVGEYEVHLYLGERLVYRWMFTLQDTPPTE